MYKVFYNNALIIIGSSSPKHEGQLRQNVADKNSLFSFLDYYLNSVKPEDTYLHGYETGSMWEDFQSYFYQMTAAGGLVRNGNGDYLFIKRFNMWDLPKGKIEARESLEECALREVMEETHLQSVSMLEKLLATYHIYFLKGKWVLKITHWYGMRTDFEGVLKPQLEEGITEVKWMDLKTSHESLATSYRSLHESLKKYLS